jgi:16S rRNA (guanine1516-N2)-methyltransferase
LSKIAVTYANFDYLEEAKRLALELNLPLCEIDSSTYSYQLVVTANQLELHTKNKNYLPITINFLSGKNRYRSEHTQYQKELLAKAVGIKGNFKPSIIDATAGLGSDGFLLGNLGCRMLMLERNPSLFALLNDAWQRFKKNSPRGNDIQLDILHVEAKDYLNSLVTDYPDVIFLDPMYPERHKSALVKKEMRILRDLIGDDVDAPDVLSLALKKAKKRVVVKRPRLAKPLNDQIPNLVFAGKSTRFDVYLIPTFVTAQPPL